MSRLSPDAVARHATEAAARLSPYLVRTPVVAAGALGARGSGGIWYKCENLQRTGSFKIRGALNKLLVVGPAERERGVVTASTGNHGLAVGTALQVTGGRGTVHVAPSTTPSKLDRIRATGMAVEFCGDGPLGAELQARAKAAAEGRIFISPYNDPDVVAGQGTVGIEIAEQIPTVEAVYVAVGGGGLIAGIAAAMKAEKPSVRIVGCWPEASPAMLQSIKAGRIVSVADAPTLSDGTAGNIEDGALTLPLCRDLIDEHVLVSEGEIATAMRGVLLTDHLLIEGAAGVAVAAYRKLDLERPEVRERESVIVLCGGNVSEATMLRILGDRP